MQIQRQVFSQEQSLKMNPYLYQSVELMAMPLLDLRERIQAELEQNPALELLEEKTTLSLDDYEAKDEMEDWFDGASDTGFERMGASADEKRSFIEGVLTRPQTLQEHLLWQWRLQSLDESDRYVGELLIQNLNRSGFHEEDPQLLDPRIETKQLEHVMALVQALDPIGCCVPNYRESLLVQARLRTDLPKELLPLLSDHFELLEQGKRGDLIKVSGLDEETIQRVLLALKSLSPFPGRQFDASDTLFVVPDLQVKSQEGDLVIVLNDEEIPVLGINPFFTKLSGNEDKDKPVRDFVRENIKDARWFIKTINQRNNTLLRVSRTIVEFQRDFFAKGPKHLAPLTLKDVAQEIDVHETTVSRMANGKYIQTEWGIFELRYFFTNAITGSGSSGSRFSKEGVKEVIREIISDEEKAYTDQELTDILAQRGISLARRTVNKYRKELDLGSSYEREGLF